MKFQNFNIILLTYFSREEAASIYTSTWDKLKLTLYYTIIVIMSNLLMFLMMTYNFGIIMAVIIGNAIGFMIFGIDNKLENMSSSQKPLH